MLINLEPRFAPAYRIKIGGFNPDVVKRADSGREWRPPVKFDHFKICHNRRDPVTGNFEPALEIMKHYAGDDGDPTEAKPASINIMLFSNQIGDIFDDWRALYMSRRCQCRTVERFLDPAGENVSLEQIQKLRLAGVTQLARWDKTQHKIPRVFEVVEETKESAFIKCPERHCFYTEKKHCKVNSIFRCMILEAPELGAVAEFRTTSIHSAMQLKKSLEMVYSMTGGHMAGIELALRLEPKTVEQGTVFVAHVVYPHGGLLQLKEAAVKFRTKELSFDRQMLIAEASVANFDETPEEAAAVEAEFYESDETGEIVVEPTTEKDDKGAKKEPDKPKETPQETEETGSDELPFPVPETSDENVESAPLERHKDCPFPQAAKVDPSYCDSDCKLSDRCEEFKGAVPWEAPDETEESPPAESTFNLFQ